MTIYVATFDAFVLDKREPRAFLTEEAAKEFCDKANQEICNDLNRRNNLLNVNFQFTIEEVTEDGEDCWVYTAVEAEE